MAGGQCAPEEEGREQGGVTAGLCGRTMWRGKHRGGDRGCLWRCVWEAVRTNDRLEVNTVYALRPSPSEKLSFRQYVQIRDP